MALGFGIGSPEAAAEAAAEADGVIIASKLMRLVAEGGVEGAGAYLLGYQQPFFRYPGRHASRTFSNRTF